MAGIGEKTAIWILTAAVFFLVWWSPPWSYHWLRERLYFSAPPTTVAEILAENQALRAELAELEEVKRAWGEEIDIKTALPAGIYSRYPLNFGNQILVAAGEKRGVFSGQAVVAAGNVLIGKVEKVFSETATVRTVFDPAFQIAVRIGKDGSEALFAGGVEPRLTFIPRQAVVAPGDIVYAVDPSLPYGLAVGEVKEVHFLEDELFQEATLRFAYDLNRLRVVFLLPRSK